MTGKNDGWILVSVSAAGFLGAGRAGVQVDFDRPLVVLLGPNGSGKSTLLAAVEWGLFGKTAVGADAEPIKGAGNEPFLIYLHRDCDEAVVSLRFERAGSELVWRRSRRRAKPRDDDLSCEIDGRSVSPVVAEVLGLSEGVYRRAVAPVQASLRALVSADADARDLALDRLFGIERFRTLTKGLAAASRELGKDADELQRRLETLFTDLQREVSRRFERRTQARARAVAEGAAPGELTQQAVADATRGLAAELHADIAAELADAAGMRAATGLLVAAADASWRSAGPVDRQKRLEGLAAALEGPRERWEQTVAGLRDREGRLGAALTADGDESVLDQRLEAVDIEIDAAGQALQLASERAAVLHSAQAWIAVQAAAADCPVCEQPVVLAELEMLVAERLRSLEGSDGSLTDLRTQIHELRGRRKSLEDSRRGIEDLRAELGVAGAAESTARARLLAGLAEFGAHQDTPDDEDAVVASVRDIVATGQDAPDLSDRLREVAASVSDALQATGSEIVAAQRASSTLRDRVQRLATAAEFLAAQSELDDLDATISSPELAAARQATQTIASWRETLRTVAQVAAAVSADEAGRRTAAITPRLAAWFERLSRHASLRSAAIDVETVKAGGSRNSYRIRAISNTGWQATRGPALSGGYQTILAVAAMCALADDPESRSGLGLLALDEPTQSLDPQMTVQLGRALGEHLQVGRLIVTTTDEAFAAAIENAAGASRARRIVFADWDAQLGIVLDGGAA